MAFTAPDEEVANPVAPASQPRAGKAEKFSAPQEDVSAHYDSLASDQTFDPVEHYRANPSPVSLDEAREVFKRRAAQPVDYSSAAGGFLKSVPGGIVSGVSDMARGVGHVLSNVATIVPGLYGNQPLTADQQRALRENAAAVQLGTQEGGDLLRGGWRNVQRLFGKTDRTLSDQEINERIQNDAASRQIEDELRKGNVVEGGLNEPLGFGEISRSAMTPEELAANGAPVNEEAVGRMSFIGNPATYAMEPAVAAGGPLVNRFVTAPILKTAGRVLSGTGEAASTVLSKTHATPLTLAHALFASHNPIAPALVFSSKLAADHVLPYAGRVLSEAGAEAVGVAPPIGQSLATKALKGTAQGVVSGSALSAPFMAASQSPEEAGQAFGAGLGLGGVLGGAGATAGSRNTEVAAKFNQLSQEGAKMNYGLGWDESHANAMQGLPPDVQASINAYRARYNGMTDQNGIPIQIYAVGGEDYARALQENHGGNATDSRGFISPDGTKIFLNADIAKPETAGGTLGHEAGGHLTEYLGELSKDADVFALQKTLQDTLMPGGKATPQFEAFMRNYSRDLAKSGAAARQVSALDPQYFLREFLAEHARGILNGESIASFHLPKPIMKRMTQGASEWLRNQGILPQEGSKLGWGANEIKNITSKLRDVLYNQGKTSESLRKSRASGQETSPSVNLRMAQLETILSNPPGVDATVSEIEQYSAANKEYDSLQKQLPKSPEPLPASNPPKIREIQAAEGVGKKPEPIREPTTPARASIPIRELQKISGGATPDKVTIPQKSILPPSTQPSSPLADITKVAASLRKNYGISSEESRQWASVAQGGTVAEKIVDALRQRANQKFQTTTTNATTPTQAAPVPAVAPGTKVAPSATDTLSKPAAPAEGAALTPESLKSVGDSAADEAERQLRADKPRTKQPAIDAARQRAALDAMAAAHAQAVGSNTDLVTMRTNKFGETTISGSRLDPSDPFHAELLRRSKADPQTLQALNTLMASQGKPVGMEYLSAPESPGAKAAYDHLLKTQQIQDLRKEAQEQSTANGRVAADSPVRRVAKSFIPLGITYNPASDVFTVNGFSPDKMLSNASKLLPWLEKKGIQSYSGVNDPKLIEDLNGYFRNHEAGYLGNGDRPIQGTPITPVAPQEGYEPHIIPKDRFDVLNAIMGDESARTVNEKGEEKGGSAEQRMVRTEKQVLASKNSPYLNPETGETNRIRELIRKEGDFKFTTAEGREKSGPSVLENAWESLRPELAENIGSPDVINEHSIRPSDFTGKVSDVEGAPKHQFVSAGFMPDAGTPKEEPTAKAAGQPPSEVLGGTPSLGNSTQKPDVDNSQLENLTREAEDAGVVLSIETLKGLIRRDPETIKRVRMRIEQNTGRPAQFDPESQSASTQSTQRGAPLVSPSRRKTTQELARERIQARSGT